MYAICVSPLARELKGTNDSCSTDGSALCACAGVCFKKDGVGGAVEGSLRLTPDCRTVLTKMEDNRVRAMAV